MKLRGGLFSLLILLACSGGAAACAPAPRSPVTDTTLLATVPEIPAGDLTGLLAVIQPRPGEARFEEIPWLASLWEGRTRGAEQGKPIVAFLMSGHPMACT